MKISEKELLELIRDAKRYRFWRINHTIVSPEQCDLVIDELIYKQGEHLSGLSSPRL